MADQGHRKQLTGTVVSDAMDKTVVVQVQRQILHPQYKKYVQRNKKYMAHDNENACTLGDLVMIQECRPLSRRKRWRVIKTLRKAIKV